MRHPSLIILLYFLFPLCLLSQGDDIKETFEDGDFFFARGDYAEAAYLYKQVLKAEPDNANIKYKLGLAYLNIPGEERNAIPYLEEAKDNITLKYRKNRYEVKKAPFHTWYYLGNAYRINNELEKALDAYEEFKSLRNFDSKYNARVTDNEIKATIRARIIQSAPLDLQKFCFEEPVNTTASDYNAIISSNEQVMVWMSSQKFYEAIMMSEKQDGKWSDPVNISPQLQSDGDLWPTGLSSDGLEMLLVRHGGYDSDIYYCTYDGTFWSKAEPISGAINSNYTEDHASFSPDGKRIYFSSARRGSLGGLDIFYSEKTQKGEWGAPVNLGSIVNTEFDETSAYMSPDGSKLYFSSKGHYNMGGYDIFYCDILDNGSFSPAVNIGFPLNTTTDNVWFNPLKDGNSGIYAMRNDEGPGNNDICYLEIVTFAQKMAKSKSIQSPNMNME